MRINDIFVVHSLVCWRYHYSPSMLSHNLVNKDSCEAAPQAHCSLCY